MFDFTIPCVIAISFIATLIRSTFGFGESLVAVPLFILFLPLEVAVPLSVLLSVVIALIVVIQDHKQIHFDSAKWLILFALPGIPLGVVILLYGSEFWVKLGLGILIIAYALYALFGKSSIRLGKDSKLWLFIRHFWRRLWHQRATIKSTGAVVFFNFYACGYSSRLSWPFFEPPVKG